MASKIVTLKDIQFVIRRLLPQDCKLVSHITQSDVRAISPLAVQTIMEVFGSESFVGAFHTPDKLAGIIGIFKHDTRVGIVGFGQVLPEFRRCGVAGHILYDSLITLDTKCVAGNVRPDAVPLVTKLGFQSTGVQMNLISIKLPGPQSISGAQSIHGSQSIRPQTGSGLVSGVCESDIKDIMSYDTTLHDCGPRGYLPRLYLDPDNIALCARNSHGEICGLLLYQPDTRDICLHGNNSDIIKELIKEMIKMPNITDSKANILLSKQNITDSTANILLPKQNIPVMLRILKELGVSHNPTSFRSERVVRGDDLPVDWSKIYGLMNGDVFNI